MALPTSRNTTYSPGSSLVKAADLNALQDMHVGQKLNALFPRCSVPKPWVLGGTWNPAAAAASQRYIVSSGGASSFVMPLDISKGERIVGVTLNVYGDGAADCTFTLWYVDATTQVTSTLCTGTDTNRSAAWASLSMSTLGAFTQRTMLEGEALELHVSANASNYRFGQVKWFTDRL